MLTALSISLQKHKVNYVLKQLLFGGVQGGMLSMNMPNQGHAFVRTSPNDTPSSKNGLIECLRQERQSRLFLVILPMIYNSNHL